MIEFTYMYMYKIYFLLFHCMLYYSLKLNKPNLMETMVNTQQNCVILLISEAGWRWDDMWCPTNPICTFFCSLTTIYRNLRETWAASLVGCWLVVWFGGSRTYLESAGIIALGVKISW